MGWNGSGGGSVPVKPRVTAKKPSPIRGIVAGLVVVVLVCVAYFAFFSAEEKPQIERSDNERGRIKEVSPAPAPKAAEPKEKKTEEKKFDPIRDKNSKLTDEQKDALIEKRIAETPIPEASTNTTFRTGLEQVIGWVFTTNLGDMPPPLPNISDFDLVHFQEILEIKNKVADEDPDNVADAKAVVDHVKKELKKYVDNGGSPDEFLQFYHAELEQAHQERRMVQQQVMEVVRTEPDIALDFLEKVNASLKEKGIKPVEIGPRDRARYGITDK